MSHGRLADIKLHPAVIVLGTVAAMSVASRLDIAEGWEAPEVVTLAGRGVFGVGVAILVVAYAMMARAHTTIDPRQPTRTVVTGGVYRVSRNPIYLGWFLFVLGGGMVRANPLIVGMALVMIGLLHRFVVLPEEAYLERAFGDEYLSYKKRVRRWL